MATASGEHSVSDLRPSLPSVLLVRPAVPWRLLGPAPVPDGPPRNRGGGCRRSSCPRARFMWFLVLFSGSVSRSSGG